jgi:hypothetical protein
MSDIKVGDVMMHRYQSREFPKPVQVKGKITQILYEFTPDDMSVMDGPVTVTAARLSKTVSGGGETLGEMGDRKRREAEENLKYARKDAAAVAAAAQRRKFTDDDLAIAAFKNRMEEMRDSGPPQMMPSMGARRRRTRRRKNGTQKKQIK